MKKNVSSQVIGAQMVSATDGSAFTGSVTCYVTGDGGTQATGSVGSGACTHEGNGFHTYAPAQSETNYNHVAFTFTGTGAVPVTIQVYTNFPQTADHTSSIADILTDTGTTLDGKINTIDTVVDGIKAVTDNLPDSGALSSLATASALATVDSNVDAILLDTAEIGAAGAGLTAVPWNSAWDAEVQSECTDALNAYDPPTNTEMEARTLVAANYATASGVSAVETDTQDIQSRLPAALVSGRMASDVIAISGSTDAADRIEESTECIVEGVCDTGGSTTSVVTSSLDPAASVDDQFIGKVITFKSDTTTAALRGQSSIVTDSTSGGVLTVDALTTAPSSGDTFVLT